MRRVLLALCLLGAASAQAQDAGVDAYWQARKAGSVGIVEGRLFSQPTTPTGKPRPLAGVTVTLLPRAADLLAKLERLKQRARESSSSFAAAAPGMFRAREAYEHQLLTAGAPDLASMVQATPEGTFRFEEVPAGAWVVLAWQATPVDLSSQKMKAKERNLYLPQTRLQGFHSVTIWLRELNVTGGAAVTEEFTDRNSWFRGVVEDRVLDTGR
jgi:hypothetical protein